MTRLQNLITNHFLTKKRVTANANAGKQEGRPETIFLMDVSI